LEVAGDTAIGLGIVPGAETAGDLLLDLAHAQIAFGAVVREGHMSPLGEEQDGVFIALEPLPEVMGIGLGDPPALPV